MLMRYLPILLLALPAWGQVFFDVKTDRVLVRVNNKLFTTLHYGREARKPYLHPLLTVSGKAVTRGFPVDPLPGDATDHPHQRGLWSGSERVNGNLDFWENEPTYHRPHMGRIDFKDLTGAINGDERGTLSLVSHWIADDGKMILIDRRRFIFYSKPEDRRTFDVELEFEATTAKFVFEDHKDAVLGLRLGLPFDDHYGGKLVNAEGQVNEPEVYGRRSRWLDWTATLEGEKVGVAIFDHPSNYGYPTRWTVRAMGLMFANPFAQRSLDNTAPVGGYTLAPHQKMHLRYRVLIHPDGVDLSRASQEFARSEAEAQ
jgi:hypothetical protein